MKGITVQETSLSCDTCKFHVEIKHPQMVGQAHLECWKNPPVPVIIPQPGPNGSTGLGVAFTHVQVNAKQFCFSHEPQSTFIGPQ